MAQTRSTPPSWHDLHGRIALVTGGGSGLGAQICMSLAREGVHVIAADLKLEGAERTAATIAERSTGGKDEAGRCEAIALDVTDSNAVADAVGRIVQRHGRLDVVVNNAAVDVTEPIDVLTVAEWQRVLQTNLTGPFVVSRHAVMHMKTAGGGHIVNIASTAAKRAWPNAAAYHASKWGLLGLSHSLHAELRPFGIKVSAVVAGGMRTPFLLDRFPGIDTSTLQDPANVAESVLFVLRQPPETVIPEVMVLPMRETSWP
ncbi:SDR family oxidoreductase [Paraburkholderia kururiensis]|uniref:SDR family oxidoreductase n=1 Tax=Paraburkholderia kururiensis TaxID=984307 RepID=UPI0018F45730|nr:SDR family oxidoreductase [Paraburkholderia kururiensis]